MLVRGLLGTKRGFFQKVVREFVTIGADREPVASGDAICPAVSRMFRPWKRAALGPRHRA